MIKQFSYRTNYITQYVGVTQVYIGNLPFAEQNPSEEICAKRTAILPTVQ